MTRFKETVLWLFIIFLGITFGAGLYESRIVVSDWTTAPDGTAAWDSQAAIADDTGRRFWGFVTTGPLTLLAITSLVLAWRTPPPVRSWWLSAAGVSIADRLLTFSYFIPTMVGLMKTADSAAARATAAQWASLNHLRHVIVLVAWLLALKALSLVRANESRLR
ncbi:MAG TPA: DUF1772 domain-containing protein [Thermoanaerobaculia bacterium]